MASPTHQAATIHASVESPFKFLISPSQSAPDMTVQGLVDRFTTLEVKDRDEENTKRTVRRLEAALKRAEMAREEAETEARSLRDDLRNHRDMAEERLREKTVLRERLDEYEKKYEKAKDRFKQQKVKHEEQMRKMQKEYMEREKLHWRQQQQLQEEVEWERKLRANTNDLVAFLEIERLVAVQAQKDRELELLARQQSSPEVRQPEQSFDKVQAHTPVQQDEPMAEAEPQSESAVDDSPEPAPEPEAIDIDIDIEIDTAETPSDPAAATTPARSHTSTPVPMDSPQATNAATTTKQTLRVPINFNDDDGSDKENVPRTPASRHVSAPPHHLKTPMTISCSTPALHPNIPDFLNTPIDREAALAAIRERRGRTKSNGASSMTPRRLGRDASAPPLGTMSAGRKSRAS